LRFGSKHADRWKDDQIMCCYSFYKLHLGYLKIWWGLSIYIISHLLLHLVWFEQDLQMMSWFFTHLPKIRNPLFGSSPMTILNIWLKHLVELQLEIGLWCCKLIFIVQGDCLVILLGNSLLLCMFTTFVAQVHYLAGTVNVQVSHMRFWHAMTVFIVIEQKLKVFESGMLRRIFRP
jgi:hypothetical protein